LTGSTGTAGGAFGLYFYAGGKTCTYIRVEYVIYWGK
jgi:hypothetical protein